ncbi:alpha/beta hydrolase [Streptomyces reniochalinae]|uniref:Alpha/beta fold hydrolase n=1 Tax=Streptomyces reniochalinae TaxID=2250578 RepID=A0A367EEY0_9ACTN|nr:alpha/beta fold hydrolase [Streptomyces reniochalinae]RCG16624.1 alpha/beta fold hydrolase [Streptomyces reniochalinae]
MPPILPGAEPYRRDGSATGVLLCHGFTGSPQSLRPWAEDLARHGLTVSLPLLPGHGTRWEDMAMTGWEDWYATVDRELRLLRERCETVFVCGLSMGGALALRLAALHGDAVRGVAVVNPSVTFPRLQGYAVPAGRFLVRSVRGITDDIAKDGRHELGYDRVPTRAAYALRAYHRVVRRDLPGVTQPLLLLHSRTDHVVPPSDSALVLGRVSSTDVTETVLEHSFHVATLDHDATRIFADTRGFIDRLTAGTPATATRGAGARDGA